ncbi:MAG: hypothetical protein AVDCRST_MAG59-233 [uncultured Thermomicrobiales bacterium]|uniref:Uncharacterized protein n=1 Tax=uncultured Thermomicrobiales bacterium TaxID=1645740 RepID=A0A6J4TX86_9BACT|nr:MAG: hypothetical protein AVDCRST_MAG59-233 [uncultured Thermomicrobiales bacterium]
MRYRGRPEGLLALSIRETLALQHGATDATPVSDGTPRVRGGGWRGYLCARR